jgi:hypothetical protein
MFRNYAVERSLTGVDASIELSTYVVSRCPYLACLEQPKSWRLTYMPPEASRQWTILNCVV